jgi:DNA-directed RNA polymerase
MPLYNPLTGQQPPLPSQLMQPPSSHDIPEFDPSSLIVLDHSLLTRPRNHIRRGGLGGETAEMEANLDICLTIGRFDRAAAVIHRLSTRFAADSPELLAFHNKYLQAMVAHMIVTRKLALVWPVQRWFEVDMQHGGVKPDATSYALMIRMSLRLLHGTKRDRTVRRYWNLATEAGVEEEVLGVPVLSELELGELSEVCSIILFRENMGL